MKNSYPEKPEVKYQKTTVEMGAVVGYMQSLLVPAEIKKSAYIIFRNESANGSKGLNNNYGGVQADSGRWPAKWDNDIVGTVAKTENGTGKVRLFVAFHGWQDSINFLIERVQDRGLYLGGYARLIAKMRISTATDLAIAYKRDWVKGLKAYKPTETEVANFLSMYRQAAKIFL
ncbi:hypothetical protein SAMN05428988_0172 [Chitinophaga sp. YR573]|uniref:hypothetical protein n=1 Tax=Chitinophaga sp. YR573 TaxID=1881040 RepID=UPI0008B6FD7F|nr:hypothetical protein [Chitinophaga sp. YR573]SEV89063.1 hypothetical protein SAMN05428988_0172 [Chitinophaga sp. YR573]